MFSSGFDILLKMILNISVVRMSSARNKSRKRKAIETHEPENEQHEPNERQGLHRMAKKTHMDKGNF